MKEGKTLQQLATEVKRQQESKRDFYAPAQLLTVHTNPADDATFARMQVGTFGQFDVSPLARQQICTHLGIPSKFADKLFYEEPDLHDHVMNELLRRRPQEKPRLIRTMDNRIRAFLSDSYQIRDNWDLLETALPALRELPFTPRVASSDVTENKLYMKVVYEGLERDLQNYIDPRVHRRPNKGEPDILRAGFILTNSEVGQGRTMIEWFLDRLACINGLIVAEELMKATHIGRRVSRGNVTAWEALTDETKRADDEAFFLAVRDMLAFTANEERFEKIMERLGETAGNPIEKRADQAVEELAKQFTLSEKEGGSVLNHLIEGGDLTQWGMVNAVTRASQDVEDYDRATEMEAMGGRIVELDRHSWRKIALN